MTLDSILTHARAARTATPVTTAREPNRNLAVITCMDARIDLRTVLGVELGDAAILRNAGGRVTEDTLRSLALATHVLGVTSVVVMHHSGCGVEAETNSALQRRTGAPIEFFPIVDHHAALREDIDQLVATPYLELVTAIAGCLFDLATGTVDTVARWERAAIDASRSPRPGRL